VGIAGGSTAAGADEVAAGGGSTIAEGIDGGAVAGASTGGGLEVGGDSAGQPLRVATVTTKGAAKRERREERIDAR